MFIISVEGKYIRNKFCSCGHERNCFVFHKILSNKNVWTKAQDLIIGSDCIKAGVLYPEMNIKVTKKPIQ